MHRLRNLITHPWFGLTLILVSGLMLRLALLPMRWINPDEGAHLLDARLMLQGLVPLVDFGSKQPFYIASLALAIKLFGVTLWVGRLFIVLCHMATVWLLYLLMKNLVSQRAGLLAAALYALLPFFVIWGVVVKTEPLAILLAVLSSYLFLLGMKQSNTLTAPLFWAGVVAGMAFFTRQSTLYLPVTVFLFLLINRSESRSFRLSAFAVYSVGAMVVFSAVGLLYSRWMSVSRLLLSPLNPLELLFSRGLHVLGLAPPDTRIADSSGFRILDQSPAVTLEAWQTSLLLSFFVIVVLFWSLFHYRRTLISLCRHSRFGYLFIWMAVVWAMYIFQSVQRGFFSQYFLEILTPVLLVTVSLLGMVTRMEKGSLHIWFPAGAVLFFLIMLVSRAARWMDFPVALNYWIGLLPLVFVLHNRLWKNWLAVAALGLLLFALPAVVSMGKFWQILIAFAAFCLALPILAPDQPRLISAAAGLLAFWLTASYSGSRLGPRFEAVWSPAALKQVCQILQPESKESTILAGASIWAFESGLQPYLNIAHPTEMQRRFRSDFADSLLQRPPDFIILDSHTQRKYNRYWRIIASELEARFERLAAWQNDDAPVTIYRLMRASAPSSKALAQRPTLCR